MAHRECLRMNTTSTQRRPLNLQVLESFVTRKRLNAPRHIDEGETVTLSHSDFVPVIQAEVGSEEAVSVYRFRVLVPINQVIRETTGKIQRLTITSNEDLDLVRNTIIRHFRGITTTVNAAPAVRGVGSRDPTGPWKLWKRTNTLHLRSTRLPSKNQMTTSVLCAKSYRRRWGGRDPHRAGGNQAHLSVHQRH